MKKFQIEWRDPETLTPYAKNAKIHSSEQIDNLANQIANFGFDQPIVVDANGLIIKGHARREASLRLGLKEVPVIVNTLEEYESIAARIGDNKVAEAPWDPELLKFDLGTLQRVDYNLKLTGFEQTAINNMLNPPTSHTEFSAESHKDVTERKEQYENSGFRQMILVMEPEEFDILMKRFAELQGAFNVETNLEVVQKLIEHYDSSGITEEDGQDGTLSN